MFKRIFILSMVFALVFTALAFSEDIYLESIGTTVSEFINVYSKFIGKTHSEIANIDIHKNADKIHIGNGILYAIKTAQGSLGDPIYLFTYIGFDKNGDLVTDNDRCLFSGSIMYYTSSVDGFAAVTTVISDMVKMKEDKYKIDQFSTPSGDLAYVTIKRGKYVFTIKIFISEDNQLFVYYIVAPYKWAKRHNFDYL